MVDVIEITPDDWQLWRMLRLAALADAPAAFCSVLATWERADETAWRDRIAWNACRNLVAQVDGEPAGMVSGVPGDDHVEVISLWTDPAFRGSGVAHRLVEEITAWATRRGDAWVRLEVKRDNEPARRLYDRLGFQLVRDGEEQLFELSLPDRLDERS